MNPIDTISQRIHGFFEEPKNIWAKLTQALIFACIIASLGMLVIEYRYEAVFLQYQRLFTILDPFILAIFTIEYVLRFATAPRKFRWASRPMNMIDFLAVFPNYLEAILPFFVNVSSLRVLRLIRALRFARVLRVFKLFKYGRLFSKVLRYEGTILQSITPVIGIFVVMKAVIWILESYGLWIADPSIGELFAIIGFALGIILSQKIGMTYDKFLQVEEAAVRIYATLRSLRIILNKVEAGFGTKICRDWAQNFLAILEDTAADNSRINPLNDELYEAMSRAEPTPGEIAMLHGEICRSSAFCLSKKVRLTPKAYDTLLHQSTMLYLTLIVAFLPGFTGMVSVIIAAYILYGMYNLTEDLDSILGGEFNLIYIDISELKQFAQE